MEVLLSSCHEPSIIIQLQALLSISITCLVAIISKKAIKRFLFLHILKVVCSFFMAFSPAIKDRLLIGLFSRWNCTAFHEPIKESTTNTTFCDKPQTVCVRKHHVISRSDMRRARHVQIPTLGAAGLQPGAQWCASCALTSCSWQILHLQKENRSPYLPNLHDSSEVRPKHMWFTSKGADEVSQCLYLTHISHTHITHTTKCFVVSLPLGIGARIWGASVEKMEFADLIQHKNNKQNLRYSIVVWVRDRRSEAVCQRWSDQPWRVSR